MEIFNSFFGSDIKREIELLRFLYKQNRFVSIEEISHVLKMDRRSIQKYYDFLVHSPLLTYEDRENILISKYGLGYKFVGTKKDYKALTKQVLQSNPFFELFETLFLENEINLVKFAYENYVSESTVRKRLYELEKLLDPIGFTLKKNKGYVYLEGNEARIRYFMVTFFWRTFSGLHWPFPNISEEKCTQISRNIYQAAQIEVNEIEIRITTYLLATNVVRYRKGYRIDPDTLRLEPPLTEGDQLLFSQLIGKDTLIFKQLQNELDQHYVFDSTEIDFIYYWLQSSLGSSFSDEQLNDYFPHSFSQSKTTTDLKKLIIAISKDSDLKKLSAEKKQLILRTILTGFLSVELFGDTDHTLTGYDMYDFVSQNFPNLFIQSEKILTTLNIYEEERKRKGLALHVATAWTLIFPPSKFMKPIKIKLETDLPPVLEQNIKERIEAPFKNFYNIDIQSNFNDDEYDLYLSTASLTETLIEHPVLLINAQVTLNDLLMIQKEIEAISQNNMSRI